MVSAASDKSSNRFRVAWHFSVHGPVHRHLFVVVCSRLEHHPEYVAYMLVHVERLALLGSVQSALICNLSYWFDRDAASRSAFASAAARAKRPDARCFTALADAFNWIDQLCIFRCASHSRTLPSPIWRCRGAPNCMRRTRLQPQVIALCENGEEAVSTGLQITAPAGVMARSRTVDALCDWLQQTRAHVIVVAPDGTTVWSPEMNDPRLDAARTGRRERLCGREPARGLAHDRRTFASISRPRCRC